VISLEGLQSQLLLGLDALFLELGDLTSKDGGSIDGRVDTVGLDGDDDVTVVLQEVVGVDTNDTGLIRLGNIGKDDIDHTDEHAVLVGVTSILNNGDDVGALLGHVDQIASRAVRELDGVDETLRSDNIGNVGNGGSGSSTEVENLLAGGDVDVVNTTEDTGSDLGTERVPDAVLDLGAISTLDRDALLTVDRLARDQVLGQEVVLLTVGNEDTLVTMGLDSDLGTTTGTTAGTTTATTVTAETATSTTAATATTTTVTTETATAAATATTLTESHYE